MCVSRGRGPTQDLSFKIDRWDGGANDAEGLCTTRTQCEYSAYVGSHGRPTGTAAWNTDAVGEWTARVHHEERLTSDLQEMWRDAKTSSVSRLPMFRQRIDMAG